MHRTMVHLVYITLTLSVLLFVTIFFCWHIFILLKARDWEITRDISFTYLLEHQISTDQISKCFERDISFVAWRRLSMTLAWRTQSYVFIHTFHKDHLSKNIRVCWFVKIYHPVHPHSAVRKQLSVKLLSLNATEWCLWNVSRCSSFLKVLRCSEAKFQLALAYWDGSCKYLDLL